MNNFLKSIRTKVKGIESMHQCGDILIKEDIRTGECVAYSRENTKKKRKLIDISEVEISVPNINDSTDYVSYRVLSLPGGRCRVINNQSDKFSLHSLQDICYGVSGEEILPSAMLDEQTIQEYIRRYQDQKQLMRYVELAKVKHNGQTAYIGTYVEKDECKYEELFGNVLLGIDMEDIDGQIREKEMLAQRMYDFGSRKCSSIGFTKKALQNIAQRDREREGIK